MTHVFQVTSPALIALCESRQEVRIEIRQVFYRLIAKVRFCRSRVNFVALQELLANLTRALM